MTMKVQLFVPPQGYMAQRWSDGSSMPPLGILYLAAALERVGITVDVVPADILRYSWQDIEKRIETFQPQLVGITTTTENRFQCFELTRRIKQLNTEIITVLGGPHISMAGKDTIQHITEADILAIGEGEETIVDLATALRDGTPLAGVNGIYYRDEAETVHFTGPRSQIQDLDTLPYPARHLIPMEKYNFFMTTRDGKKRKAQNIMTSRGCPFDCYFCATPVNWGRQVRGHTPERVLAEIENLIADYGAEFIWFYDDTLNYNPSRLEKIMDMIIERQLNIKFANEFRIDIIEKPLLEKMVAAGLEIGFFGIEAGASRIRQQIVNKNFPLEKAYQFIEWSKELGLIPAPFFIFSHYTETWGEAQETLKIIEKIKRINSEADISAAILHIYPGTQLEALAKKEGIIPADFSWSKQKDMRRVANLPAAQGDVPLFKHILSWRQIAHLVMGWSVTSKKKISKAKIKQALKSVFHFKDLLINLIFFLTLISMKLKKLCKK